MENNLTPRMVRFVEEISNGRTNSQTQAAINAGFAPKNAGTTAARLMADPRIVDAITERVERLRELANIDPLFVLQQWVQIATADPSRVVQTRRLNCRYCHGVNHAYQYSDREYAELAARAMDEGSGLAALSGGGGWRHNADPHPDCPECQGEGVVDVFHHDTRYLTGPERLLIAGVKTTRGGIEIKMRDQDGAVKQIADYLGMIVKRGELTGANGRPLFGPAPKLPMVEQIPDDPKALAVYYREMTGG